MINLFNTRRRAAALVVACGLALSACGGGAGGGPGAPGGPVAGPADGLVAATQGSMLIRPTPEAAGAQCAAGGTRVDSGIDANGNSLLDAAEVAATAFVCNGLPGANGSNGTNGSTGATGPAGSAGAQGPDGSAGAVGATGAAGATGPAGSTGSAGSAGATGATGSAGATGTAGATGLATLLLTSAEPSGANCAAGGVKVQAGTDADRNGALAPGEVSTTSFVCNGINGVSGVGGSGKYWQNAARVDTGTPAVGSGVRPRVVYDNSGNALALWDGGGDLSSSSYTPATGWSAPVKVNVAASVNKFDLAINPQGVAVAFWQQFAGGKTQAWASRREGGVWLAPVRINAGADTDALDLAVAINASGDATAIWYEKRSTGQIDVKARRYQVFVSSWDAAITTLQADTASFGGDVYGLSVAMDNTSAAIAAYTRDGGGGISLIDTKHYVPLVGWSGLDLTAVIPCIGRQCSAPKVVMNNIGHAMLVWAGNAQPGNVNVAQRAVFAARYSAGNWDTPVGLRSGLFNTTGAVQTPDVALDAAGNAVAVWAEYDLVGAQARSYTARFTAPTVGNAFWGASETISSPGYISQPKVALDASGNAQAVWVQEDNAQVSSIWSNRFNTNTAWGSPTRIHTTPPGNAVSPQVAVDPSTGSMLAIWLLDANGFGTLSGIWANFLR